MPQLYHLLTEIHLPAAPGCQKDRPDGNLSGQAEGVSRRCSIRDNDLAPLGGERFDRLLYGGGPRAESARDGANIHAATRRASVGRARQGAPALIHRRPISKVEQSLADTRAPSGIPSACARICSPQPLHRRPPVSNLCAFLTVFKEPPVIARIIGAPLHRLSAARQARGATLAMLRWSARSGRAKRQDFVDETGGG